MQEIQATNKKVVSEVITMSNKTCDPTKCINVLDSLPSSHAHLLKGNEKGLWIHDIHLIKLIVDKTVRAVCREEKVYKFKDISWVKRRRETIR